MIFISSGKEFYVKNVKDTNMLVVSDVARLVWCCDDVRMYWSVGVLPALCSKVLFHNVVMFSFEMFLRPSLDFINSSSSNHIPSSPEALPPFITINSTFSEGAPDFLNSEEFKWASNCR